MLNSINSGLRSLGISASKSGSELESKSPPSQTGQDIEVSSGKSPSLLGAFADTMARGQQLLAHCADKGIKLFVSATLIQQASSTQTPTLTDSKSLVTPTPTWTETGTFLPDSRSGNVTYVEDFIR